MNQKMSSLFSSGLENLSEFHGWRIFPVIRPTDHPMQPGKIGGGHFQRKSTLVWIIKFIYEKKFAVFTFYKFPTLLFLTVMADTHSHTRKVPLSHTFSRTHARTSTHYTNTLTLTHTRAREKKTFSQSKIIIFTLSLLWWRENHSEVGSQIILWNNNLL